MMAENEVTNKASEDLKVEEKCGYDVNSSQYLLKPQCNGANHHNEANDLDNSYVFVTETDGLSDDAVGNKDIATEGSSVPPQSKAAAIEDQGSELNSQNAKLNSVDGEVNDEPVNEGENKIVEQSNDDQAAVKDNNWKQENSLEVEDGERVQDPVADSLEEHNGKIPTSTEVEVKHVENPGEKAESSEEAEIEKVGVLRLDAESGLEACLPSQDAVVDVSELKSQDVSVGAGVEADDDVKLTTNVVETGEHLSPSTSLDLNLESYPNKEETLKDVPKNQQCDTTLGYNSQGAPEHIDNIKTVASSTDCHAECGRDLVLEEKDEDLFVSHGDSGIQSREEPERNNDSSIISSETMRPEFETVASVQTQSIPDSNTDGPQTEIGNSDAEPVGAVSSIADSPKSEIIEQILPSIPEIECVDAVEAVSASLDGPKLEIAEQGIPSHPEIECSNAEAIGAVPHTLVDGAQSEITEKGLPNLPETECTDDEFVGAVPSSSVGGPKSEVDEQGIPSHPEIESSNIEAIGTVPPSLIDGPKSGITENELPSLCEVESSDAEAIVPSKSETDEQGLPSPPEIECSGVKAIGTIPPSPVDGPKPEITEKAPPSLPEIECSDVEAIGATPPSLDDPKPEMTENGLPGRPEFESSQAEAIEAVSPSPVDGPKSEIDEQGLPSLPEIERSDVEAIAAVPPPVDGPYMDIAEKALTSLSEIECSDVEAIGGVSPSVADGPKSDITEEGLPSRPEVESSDAEAIEAVSPSLVDGPKSEVDEQGLPSLPEIECSDVEAIVAVPLPVDGPKSEITEKALTSLPEIECSDVEAIGGVSPSVADGPKSEITEEGLPSLPEVESSDAEAIKAVSTSLIDGPKSEIDEQGLPSPPEIEFGTSPPSPVDGSKSEITEKALLSLPEMECSDVEAIPAVSPSVVDGPKPEITENGLPSLPEVEISEAEAESIEAVSSSLVEGPKLEITEKRIPSHPENEYSDVEATGSVSSSLVDGPQLDVNEKVSSLPGGEAQAETKDSIGEVTVADIPPETFDVKFEPEVSVHNFSAIENGENANDASVVTEALGSSDNECVPDTIEEIEDIDDKGDLLDGSASSNDSLLQENDTSGNSHSNNIYVASPEGSSASMVNGEEASTKTKIKPFNFLIRVPRFDDESLREQIRLAKLHVDEKTKLRDAIQLQIHETRANNQIHGVDYEYAKTGGREARKLLRSKRNEIDSLQSVINKAKNALSIEDIDSQIHNKEHMIQHETLPLKEEKQFIREIKQLKQLREQLSSNMGSQDEIKQALEQREGVEERLKILRKELDILKDRVRKADVVAIEAEKKYDHEDKKVKELQTQFRVADDVRQAAYAQWQSLRSELIKKSQHFFKYKDDATVASNYAFSRDTEALYRLCTNHVDNFMELWNTNPEFRREYVKFNTRSTVRRFGTLDGRSLGPGEEPHILPSYVDYRTNYRMVSTPVKADLVSQVAQVNLKQETVTENGKPAKKVAEPNNQKVTKREPAATVQVKLHEEPSVEVPHEEEPKKSKEEMEAIRKEEEMRREEAEVKLKEQRRLEELAKANEARQRKKRQAEKLQMRAELKAQKEAEEKEKEKEKRLRKKERKKAGATDMDANEQRNTIEPPPPPSSESDVSKDIETKDTSSSVKGKKVGQKTKQSKTKSIPPPLRNRNKKKWQQWLWVCFTSLIIVILFCLGNMGLFSNLHFRRRSPVI